MHDCFALWHLFGEFCREKEALQFGKLEKNAEENGFADVIMQFILEHIWSANENGRGKPQQCCWFKGIEFKDQTSWVRLLQPQEAGLAQEGAGDRALQSLLVSHG